MYHKFTTAMARQYFQCVTCASCSYGTRSMAGCCDALEDADVAPPAPYSVYLHPCWMEQQALLARQHNLCRTPGNQAGGCGKFKWYVLCCPSPCVCTAKGTFSSFIFLVLFRDATKLEHDKNINTPNPLIISIHYVRNQNSFITRADLRYSRRK